MRILFLDDKQERIDKFLRAAFGQVVQTCMTAEEAIQLLTAHKFDLCSLDHDLSWEHSLGMNHEDGNTGHEVAKFIEKNFAAMPVIVHSVNQYGATRMVKTLAGHSVHIPFSSEKYWKTLNKTFELNK